MDDREREEVIAGIKIFLDRNFTGSCRREKKNERIIIKHARQKKKKCQLSFHALN